MQFPNPLALRRLALSGPAPQTTKRPPGGVLLSLVLLLSLMPHLPAWAQSNADVLFAAGFEDPCGFPGVAFDSISFGAGSVGAEVTLNGNSLEAPAFRAFLVGPSPGETLRVELQITDRQGDRIVSSIQDPLLVGAYDVVLETCTQEIVLAGAYQTPTFAPIFGQPGQQISMDGAAFGSDSGTIFVAEASGELEAGVIDWRDGSVRFALDAGHASNGPRGVRISAPAGSLQLTDGLVIQFGKG